MSRRYGHSERGGLGGRGGLRRLRAVSWLGLEELSRTMATRIAILASQLASSLPRIAIVRIYAPESLSGHLSARNRSHRSIVW